MGGFNHYRDADRDEEKEEEDEEKNDQRTKRKLEGKENDVEDGGDSPWEISEGTYFAL